VIDQYVSPSELRRLISTLLVTAGAITIFGLFALIVVPGLRNANKPPASPPVAAPQGESGWLDPTEYPPERGYELPPVDPKTVMTANPELLKRGKALFEQHCVACHGPAGHGDGPGGAGTSPRPRDFTKAEGWKNGYQLTAIYKTLNEGIKGSAMVSYDYVRARDRMALAHYVQSLGSFPHGPDDQAGLDALAAQFASGGEQVPNKIPVHMAMAKLEAEFKPVAPLSAPAPNDGDASAVVFARAVVNRARAAQTLALAPAWHENAAALAALVSSGAPDNGFAVSVATLSPQQWQALYDGLVRVTR
jgi:mono/diheme cytochrome c family protein